MPLSRASWDPRRSPLAAALAGALAGSALVLLFVVRRVWALQRVAAQLGTTLEGQAVLLQELSTALGIKGGEAERSRFTSSPLPVAPEMLSPGSDLLSSSWTSAARSPAPDPVLQEGLLQGHDPLKLSSLEGSFGRYSSYSGFGSSYAKEQSDLGSSWEEGRRRYGDGFQRHTRYHDDYYGFSDLSGDYGSYSDDFRYGASYDDGMWGSRSPSYSSDFSPSYSPSYSPYSPAYSPSYSPSYSSSYTPSYGLWETSWSEREARSTEQRQRLRRALDNRTFMLEAAIPREPSAPSSSKSRSDVKGITDSASASPPWRIPHVLHQTWKTDQVPAKFERHLASWRRLHPSWRFEFWDDEASRELIAERFPKYLRQYDRMSGIKRADVARLAVLFLTGGVYADIDVEAEQPLDSLLAAADATHAGVLLGEENFVHSVLLEHKTDTLVSNAVLAGAPGHPFWEEVLNDIFSNSWCGDDPVQCTGPRVVDRISWEHIKRNPGCRQQGCVVRLPFDYFSPQIARWNAGNMVKECVEIPEHRRSFDRYGLGRGRGASAWSAGSMDPLLDGLPPAPPPPKGRQKDIAVKEACRSLERALENPSALHSNRTYAVHHWQCSWCREDEGLRHSIPLAEVVARAVGRAEADKADGDEGSGHHSESHARNVSAS